MARDDPMTEIYSLMDKAGLTPSGLYNSKKPMAMIVNDIRTRLANDLKALIERREQGDTPDGSN